MPGVQPADVVGLELDLRTVRERGRTAVAVSYTSIALPFGLGVMLAVPLYARVGEPGGSMLHFALFMGAAMSITAFPVLARILAERNLLRTRIGALRNTRGLMELVILNIGLELGVLGPAAFGMMVVMAIVTTFMTTPLLVYILGERRPPSGGGGAGAGQRNLTRTTARSEIPAKSSGLQV